MFGCVIPGFLWQDLGGGADSQYEGGAIGVSDWMMDFADSLGREDMEV